MQECCGVRPDVNNTVRLTFCNLSLLNHISSSIQVCSLNLRATSNVSFKYLCIVFPQLINYNMSKNTTTHFARAQGDIIKLLISPLESQ